MSVTQRRVTFRPHRDTDPPDSIGIILRRGHEADWLDENPVLLECEAAIDLTNQRLKIGDGHSTWRALPYARPKDALRLLLNARKDRA